MYCSVDDIRAAISPAELVHLTDEAGTGEVNEGLVTVIIADVAAVVDGHLRARYPLPLSTTPALLKSVSVDLVVAELYKRRLRTDVPDSIFAAYKNAMALLDKIQKGLIQLGIETKAEPSVGGAIRVNKDSQDKLFNKDLMSRF